jgi:hypothetical protein
MWYSEKMTYQHIRMFLYKIQGWLEMLHAFLNSSQDGSRLIPSRIATDAVIDSENE